MALRIIVPKRWISTGDIYNETFTHPLFFLGGPVRGGGDWQHAMSLALAQRTKDCVVACPYRWDETHPLAQHFVKGPEKDAALLQLLTP